MVKYDIYVKRVNILEIFVYNKESNMVSMLNYN